MPQDIKDPVVSFCIYLLMGLWMLAIAATFGGF